MKSYMKYFQFIYFFNKLNRYIFYTKKNSRGGGGHALKPPTLCSPIAARNLRSNFHIILESLHA